MAEKQTINIDIQSAANTAGVDKMDAAITTLTAAEQEYLAKKAQFLTAAEAEVAEVERLVQAHQKQEQSLFALEAAEQAAARSNDVLEAKRRLAIRTLNSSSNEIKGFGNFVNQAGFQVTDFAVQVQGGTSAVTAFSQQFPQLIGSIQQSGVELGKIQGGLASMPIGIGTAISIGAVAIGVGVKMAVDAYDKMKAAEAELAAAVKRNADQKIFIAEQLIKLQNQEREEFILSVYKEQADELERQGRALQRLNELRSAQGNTAQAQADAAVTVAQNTGGNVGAAQANALGVGSGKQVR